MSFRGLRALALSILAGLAMLACTGASLGDQISLRLMESIAKKRGEYCYVRPDGNMYCLVMQEVSQGEPQIKPSSIDYGIIMESKTKCARAIRKAPNTHPEGWVFYELFKSAKEKGVWEQLVNYTTTHCALRELRIL